MSWVTVLGIPAAIYIASITALMFRLLDMPMSWFAALGSGSLAVSVYTLHRSSIHTCEHMQKRHTIALQYKLLLQIISVLSLVASAIFFWLVHDNLLLLIVTAPIGIIVYGRKTLIEPVRTFMFLKPIVVGGGIAFFAWFVAGMPSNYMFVVGFFLICSADALLCDLNDRKFDHATGCETLAIKLDTVWVWVVSFGLYGLALSFLQPTIGMLFVFLFPLPLLLQVLDMRFIVDTRPLLVLLIAWVL